MDAEIGYAETAVDFTAEFDSAAVENARSAEATQNETSGGVTMPGIFLHPAQEGDARAEFRVSFPELTGNERLYLAFDVGLRDGVQLDDPEIDADGVLCGVELNGIRFFETLVDSNGWRPFILDVGAFAGEEVSAAFTANAVDNSNFDWFSWGNPRLYRVWSARAKSAPERIDRGLAIVRSVDQRLCARRFRFDESLPAVKAAADALDGFGDLPADRMGVYAFTPKLSIRSLASSSDLLFSGKNYDMRCVVENTGEASVEDFHQIQVGISGAAIRRGRADLRAPRLAPGESAALSWQMRPLNRRESVDIAAAVKCETKRLIGERDSAEATARFLRAMPSMPSRIAPESRAFLHDNYALLESGSLRLAFIREGGAYEYYALFVEKSGRPRDGRRQPALFKSDLYRRGRRGALAPFRADRRLHGRVQHRRHFASLHRHTDRRRGGGMAV